jgi:hypothetical protein
MPRSRGDRLRVRFIRRSMVKVRGAVHERVSCAVGARHAIRGGTATLIVDSPRRPPHVHDAEERWRRHALNMTFGAPRAFHFRAFSHVCAWSPPSCSQLFEFLAFVIPFQIALFGVMWWRNIKHRDEMEQERTARAEQDRRQRQEQVRRARDQAERNDRK